MLCRAVSYIDFLHKVKLLRRLTGQLFNEFSFQLFKFVLVEEYMLIMLYLCKVAFINTCWQGCSKAMAREEVA